MIKQDLEALYVFRYGTSVYSEATIFAGGRKSLKMDFHWLFFALKYAGRWILADTGFSDPKYIKAFGIAWTDPLELLQGIGVAPPDVDMLLLTHAHFDHVGLVAAFPESEIYISKAALESVNYPPARGALKASKRLHTSSGTWELLPGLELVEIGGHTAGSSVVNIRAGDKTLTLTGDEAYVPDNWRLPRANGSTVNLEKNQRFLQRLHDQVESGAVEAYSFHDPGLVTGADPILRIF